MKTFDWNIAEKSSRPDHFAWLKENHERPVTLDEYITFRRSLRPTDNRKHRARRYGKSALTSQFNNLREQFGFFPPTT